MLATLIGCQVVGDIDKRSPVSPTQPEAPATATATATACDEGAPSTCEDGAPRACVAGEWVKGDLCSGKTPVCIAGACRANRSCASGKPGAGSSCGAASGSSDCCESLAVKGGTFFRNYDGYGTEYVGPDGTPQSRLLSYDERAYPATLSDFRLDAFEVTVGRFRAFLAESGGTQENPPKNAAGAHPKVSKSGWDPVWNTRLLRDRRELEATLTCGKQVDDPITWTAEPGPYESHPMLCVDWYEAFAFCAWDGGRLPSDAELNYASSGGSQQRLFPWEGNEISNEHAVFSCYEIGCLPAVGSRPKGKGRWGHVDLLGSAMEWALDTYDLPRVPCNDCVATDDAPSRAARGGSYGSQSYADLFSANGRGRLAEQRLGMGFRCARDQ